MDMDNTWTISHLNYHVHIIYKIRTNRNTCMTGHRKHMVDNTLRPVERTLAKKEQ